MYNFSKLKADDRITVKALASGPYTKKGYVLNATVSSVFGHSTYFTGDDGHMYQSTDCYHLGGNGSGERLGHDWELIHAPSHALSVSNPDPVPASFFRAGLWLAPCGARIVRGADGWWHVRKGGLTICRWRAMYRAAQWVSKHGESLQ